MTLSTCLLSAWLVAQATTPSLTPAPRPGGLPKAELPDGLGVNIHFTDPKPGELERFAEEKAELMKKAGFTDEELKQMEQMRQPGEMERFAEAGFRWVRNDLAWSAVERERGHYDFSAYDRLVDAMTKAGARVLFILDYGNDLYDGGKAPATDEARAGFVQFASESARHFAGKGVLWEIWNEPNLAQFWKPAPDSAAYATLALATARAIRLADPDATIIGPGTSELPWEFLEEVFRRGLLNELDAISVHPYRESWPETVVEDYGRLRALIARYATADRRQLPILSSEWGYSTANGRWSEPEQASYLVRQWLVNISQGVNLSIFYDWKDDGSDPAENEHRFGTVRQDLSPKPSFEAAKALISELRGYSFRHRLFGAQGDPTWRLLFQKGDADDYLLVSWKVEPTQGRSSELPKFEPIAKGHALYDQMRTLAAVRIAPGPMAEIGEGAEYVPLQIVTTDRAPIRILGTVHLGQPEPLYQFDGPMAAVGLPLTRSASRVPRRAMLVSWAVGDAKPEFSTLIDLWRADPIELAAVPDATGVRISVKNPARTGFKGLLQVMTRQPPAVVARQPVVIGEGDESYAIRLARPQGAHDYFLTTDRNEQIAAPVALRVQPLAGFPTGPGARSGWSSVLAVENQAQKPQPVVALALSLDPTAPGPVGLDQPYQFDLGWRYVSLVPGATASIPEDAQALTLWVRAELHGDHLRSRVRDATGQVFQFDLPSPRTADWAPVRIPLDGSKPGTHWGGANDGVLHKPLAWEALLLIDSSHRESTHSGRVQIAAPFYLLVP